MVVAKIIAGIFFFSLAAFIILVIYAESGNE